MRTFLLVTLSVISAQADTLSNNLSKTTSGVESAEGTTYLTASFTTSSTAMNLDSVTLLLANTTQGQATVTIHSDGGLKPGTQIAVLNSPASYSASAGATVFTTAGSVSLSANSTYWIVLKATSGKFDWSWTADNTGDGAGYTHTWGISSDSGSTWYTYAAYPTQFLVSASSGASNCTYSLSSTTLSAAAAASNGSVTLTTTSGCAWSATSNAGWLAVTAGASGTGSGTVTFTIAENTTSASRTGTITIGGQTLTITQVAPAVVCTYSLGASSATFSAAVASAGVILTATTGCAWSALSSAAWITFPGTPSGTGSGTITYIVAENTTGSTRSGTITAGGQTLTIIQAPGSVTCVYSLSTSTATFPLAGGSGTFAINTTEGCGWSVTSGVSWITLAVANGAGSGAISYAVSPNGSGVTRSGVITAAGQTFTVLQSATAPAGLTFVPVTPCRIADTRLATGPFGGPRMNASETRSFTIPASSCAIPSTAAAYALNLTVVPNGPLGYITLFPTGQTQPLVSTLNSFDGRIKANAAIVPAGTNGAISVYTTNSADVILDINGYFVPSGGLAFYPLTPCRVADTRLATGALGGPLMSASQTRTFPVQSACGIPSNAQAYSLNITAVPRTALGYLTTWPTGSSQPLVSTLNAPTGAVTANAAIVPAGTAGAINVFVTNDADVILDINGYFAPAGTGGLSLYALTPCRLLDTRLAQGSLGGPSMSAGQTRAIPVVASSCSVPTTAQAYSLNATVVPKTTLDYLTLWASGGAQPFVSTLNAFDGSTVANAAIVPASAGSINAYVTQATDLILDINSYFAP